MDGERRSVASLRGALMIMGGETQQIIWSEMLDFDLGKSMDGEVSKCCTLCRLLF